MPHSELHACFLDTSYCASTIFYMNIFIHFHPLPYTLVFSCPASVGSGLAPRCYQQECLREAFPGSFHSAGWMQVLKVPGMTCPTCFKESANKRIESFIYIVHINFYILYYTHMINLSMVQRSEKMPATLVEAAKWLLQKAWNWRISLQGDQTIHIVIPGRNQKTKRSPEKKTVGDGNVWEYVGRYTIYIYIYIYIYQK